VGLALGLKLLPERLVVGAHLGYECIALMGGGLFCPRVRHRVRHRARVDGSAPIRSLTGAECATLAKSLPEQNAEKKTLTASKFIANSSPLGNIGNKVGMRESVCVTQSDTGASSLCGNNPSNNPSKGLREEGPRAP
jgi:hypothetical protein